MQFDFSQFISISQGRMSFEEMLKTIFAYTHEETERDYQYQVIIGSDSEGYGNVSYATAVVVRRIGSGARAFICKNKVFTNKSLRHKIYNEVALSMSLAQELIPRLVEFLGEDFVRNDLVIHVDIGQKGKTKDMIKEVVGMVAGSGLQVEIKPDAAVASTVADRYTAPPRKQSRAELASI